jgi:membrane fusion protein, heavy metal efflux system
VIEAADTVQAQNDFIAAMTATNKAKSALDLADIQYKRAKDLYEGQGRPAQALPAGRGKPGPGAE